MVEPIQPSTGTKYHDIHGPDPKSFGIRNKKPATEPGYTIFQQSNVRHRQIDEVRARLKCQSNLFAAHIRWEEKSEQRLITTAAKVAVRKKLDEVENLLEERQLRLRKLLSDEETELIEEARALALTSKQKKESMIERAKFLKERRENERQKLAKKKLDQVFRKGCDPLRAAITKKITQQIAEGNRQELDRMKVLREEQRIIEDSYNKLRQREFQKMVEKEEKERAETKKKNEELVNVLRQQMAQLEANKQKEAELKQEEMKLLKEQNQLDEVTERMAMEEETRKKKAIKDDLEKTMKNNLKRKAEREKEEMEADLKALQAIMEKCVENKQLKYQKKMDNKKEVQLYLQYVQDLVTMEQARKKEMERAISEDIENQWQKRVKVWQQNRQRRRELMNEVLRIRSRQVMDKLVAVNEEKAEVEKERENVLQNIEANKELEADEINRQRKKRLQYQQDLKDQIAFNQSLEKNKLKFEEEDHKKMLQEEAEIIEKVDNILKSNIELCERTHPLHQLFVEDPDHNRTCMFKE
ncbi:cilia- and flagella-associated protein 53-like [Argonauta hians]